MASSMELSSDSEQLERRKCPKCGIRMSSFSNDNHSTCSKCRGNVCALDSRCEECILWSDELFSKYMKHQRALKSKSKKITKVEKTEPSSRVLGDGNPSDFDVDKSSGSSMSASEIKSLISDSMLEFSNTMAASMSQSYSNIQELISTQIGSVRQDFNLSLADNPPHPPVQQSSSQGRSDPSRPMPHIAYGKAGAEVGETEGDVVTDSPIDVFMVREALASLGTAGVSEGILNTVKRVVAGSVAQSRGEVGWDPQAPQLPRAPHEPSVPSEQPIAPSEPQVPQPIAPSEPQAPQEPSFKAKLRRLANAPVNFGASSSQAKTSFFDIPDDVSVVDDDSLEKDKIKAPMPEGLKRFFKIIGVLCPEAKRPQEPTTQAKACKFEGMFSGLVNSPKEDYSPVLFHRVAEILESTAKKFRDAAEVGKAPSSSLPFRRKVYASSGDANLSKPSAMNASLPRLTGNVSSNRSAGFTLAEASKLEGVAKHAIETQSVSFWAFNALMQWLKEEGFTPVEPFIYDELIQAFSLSMVNSTSSLAALATFFKAKRREAVLSHFPPNVGKHFKDQLQASSFDSEYLFDETVLNRVLVESREDSAVSANVALSKAFSLPVFGGAKTGGKASTTQSSAPQAASSKQSSYRGKGRGYSKGQKRKYFGNNQNYNNNNNSNSNNQGGKDAKSARGGNSARGRGFTQ